jgi:hypothetical protein
VRLAPGIPHALWFLGRNVIGKNSGNVCRGNAAVWVFVIASAAKQSTLTLLHDGLLRGACHRAALRADPLARNDGFGCLKIEFPLSSPAQAGDPVLRGARD